MHFIIYVLLPGIFLLQGGHLDMGDLSPATPVSQGPGLCWPHSAWLHAEFSSGHGRGSKQPEINHSPPSVENLVQSPVIVRCPLCSGGCDKVSSATGLLVFQNVLCSGHLVTPPTLSQGPRWGEPCPTLHRRVPSLHPCFLHLKLSMSTWAVCAYNFLLIK